MSKKGSSRKTKTRRAKDKIIVAMTPLPVGKGRPKGPKKRPKSQFA